MAEKTLPWWRRALNFAIDGLRTGFGLLNRPAKPPAEEAQEAHEIEELEEPEEAEQPTQFEEAAELEPAEDLAYPDEFFEEPEEALTVPPPNPPIPSEASAAASAPPAPDPVLRPEPEPVTLPEPLPLALPDSFPDPIPAEPQPFVKEAAVEEIAPPGELSEQPNPIEPAEDRTQALEPANPPATALAPEAQPEPQLDPPSREAEPFETTPDPIAEPGPVLLEAPEVEASAPIEFSEEQAPPAEAELDAESEAEPKVESAPALQSASEPEAVSVRIPEATPEPTAQPNTAAENEETVSASLPSSVEAEEWEAPIEALLPQEPVPPEEALPTDPLEELSNTEAPEPPDEPEAETPFAEVFAVGLPDDEGPIVPVEEEAVAPFAASPAIADEPAPVVSTSVHETDPSAEQAPPEEAAALDPEEPEADELSASPEPPASPASLPDAPVLIEATDLVYIPEFLPAQPAPADDSQLEPLPGQLLEPPPEPIPEMVPEPLPEALPEPVSHVIPEPLLAEEPLLLAHSEEPEPVDFELSEAVETDSQPEPALEGAPVPAELRDQQPCIDAVQPAVQPEPVQPAPEVPTSTEAVIQPENSPAPESEAVSGDEPTLAPEPQLATEVEPPAGSETEPPAKPEAEPAVELAAGPLPAAAAEIPMEAEDEAAEPQLAAGSVLDTEPTAEAGSVTEAEPGFDIEPIAAAAPEILPEPEPTTGEPAPDAEPTQEADSAPSSEPEPDLETEAIAAASPVELSEPEAAAPATEPAAVPAIEPSATEPSSASPAGPQLLFSGKSADEEKAAAKQAAMQKKRDEESENSPFSVSVGLVYDGPLDLLLDLIRKQDIDIYDIPIARITAQFLAYVNQLKATDVDVAGEFIYTASLLIHIKSKMLLPRAPGGPEEAAEDPRRELVERLLEHERFKNAAQMLQQKQMLEAATWTNPGFKEFKNDQGTEQEIAADTTDLVRIFREILERARSRPIINVEEDSVTVGQMIRFLGRRLTMEDKPVALRQLLSNTRSERALIAMFLALLELVRLQAVLLRQDRAFSDILVKKHTSFDAVINDGLANARDDWR